MAQPEPHLKQGQENICKSIKSVTEANWSMWKEMSSKVKMTTSAKMQIDGQDNQNHLEERLLDQAQARASYTPLFWGHSRSIPQGMILDVQPLVKSLFCPIRPSPNGFFDFEASTP